MKEENIKKLRVMNREAAELFISLDKAAEEQTGQSMLGKTRTFLEQILDETRDSAIPGAFNAVLNSRLTNQVRSAALLGEK